MNFKDADILAHAVHSRLQLARDRVVFKKEWDSAADYIRVMQANWDLIKAIRKSISIAHRAEVKVDPHVYDGIKMFMFTMGWTSEHKYRVEALE